jgi:hypothetical protein
LKRHAWVDLKVLDLKISCTVEPKPAAGPGIADQTRELPSKMPDLPIFPKVIAGKVRSAAAARERA